VALVGVSVTSGPETKSLTAGRDSVGDFSRGNGISETSARLGVTVGGKHVYLTQQLLGMMLPDMVTNRHFISRTEPTSVSLFHGLLEEPACQPSKVAVHYYKIHAAQERASKVLHALSVCQDRATRHGIMSNLSFSLFPDDQYAVLLALASGSLLEL